MEGVSAELDRESLKKMFPNLARELQADENKVRVNSVRTDQEEGQRVAVSQSFDDYMPDAVDFIRRCDTEEQVEEIIRYLEKRGEIDKEYAQKLRKQLKEKGVRSFGTKKEQDYYLKHSRR
jgi:hypothetical protein